MADTDDRRTTQPPVSAAVLSLHHELTSGEMMEIGNFEIAGRDVRISKGRDALWVIVRRPGRGGLAIRAAHAPGGCAAIRKRRASSGQIMQIEMESVIGTQWISFETRLTDLPVLRITARLKPSADLLIPFLSRDLYPLDASDNPLGAKGRVEAAQRGLNAGLSFFHIDEPRFGTVLYLQNLTAMNDYYRATHTKPDGAVGGEWPEIGYLPPTPPQSGTPPTHALPMGTEVTISDALLVFRDDSVHDEQDSAERFLQMLGAAYRQLDLPVTDFRDWPGRADRTLRDLQTAPAATIRHYGHTYVRPYTNAEYPDVMVQMSLIASIHDYASWRQSSIDFEHKLASGLHKFHDRNLKTMRRYLPNVGEEKDKNAVDSWYLYHPLLNLGRMALDGDTRCERLFKASLVYAIRAAQHFDYAWPIQFKVQDFSVIVESRNEDGLGQTDVGGIYAYVMLQAFELTNEQRFLAEARAAIDAAQGMRFELNYQANLTAWGASACMRLWRITNEEYYLRQSYVYLASFFHNTEIWESEIERAVHFRNFLGATCLHDGPYMALYECFDSFAAFERYLKDSGPDLEPAARMLVSEYCKYALDRAWFYFPDALPKDILAEDVRNGYIDSNLSFPLEDLYADGQPAGQVGQEIYGAGAAFVFASRSFHKVSDEPFLLFCDHFLLASERSSNTSMSFQLGGGDGCRARVSFVRTGRRKLPSFAVQTAGGDRIRPQKNGRDRVDYLVPANGRIAINW